MLCKHTKQFESCTMFHIRIVLHEKIITHVGCKMFKWQDLKNETKINQIFFCFNVNLRRTDSSEKNK